MRTSHAGSLRFPELRQSSQGESGPKPRLRSVGDGHAVHIRQPPTFVLRLTISIHVERSALGLRSRERFCLNRGGARERSTDRDRTTTKSQAKRSADMAIVRKSG